ncbi:type II secretion system protein GspL [Chromatiaceae bacterium AAb-1]|nr:type II secretion system protein GspL [Chromatiaceae bacterium AAb-1]
MSEQIVIRLGSRAEQRISWLVWAGFSQEVIASGEISGAAGLAELAGRLGARPVTLLVPASDVVLKHVNLPGKPNRQLLQALPYMLEEEQAEDIEQLVITTGSAQQQDGQYLQQVAIIRRLQLESWLDWLQQAGFQVNRMVPDALLLPGDTLPACIQLHEQWLLKQDNWQATAIDSNWWQDYLTLAQPPQLTSYSPWPQGLAVPHQLAEPELPLALLAKGLTQTDFNLLQGNYAPKRQANRIWQQWRLVAALLVAAVSIHLLNEGVSAWQLSRQAAQLQQQAQAAYTEAFPSERVVNLSVQLRQKLAAVNGGGQPQSFLALLSVLQLQLGQIPDMQLDNLRYDGRRNELRFQAKGAGFQSFERLKAALEQAGFTVEQGALSNDGAKVQGTVSMRGKV